MDYQAIINQYYPEENKLKHILLVHSRSVANKALAIVDQHPELHIDRQFVEEAAMLHDIGIFKCNAPGIQCFGNAPYIQHGRIGAELLRNEGYPQHARVCERHTVWLRRCREIYSLAQYVRANNTITLLQLYNSFTPTIQ